MLLVIRDASRGHWLHSRESRPCEEKLKRDGDSMGYQGVTEGCLKKVQYQKNPTCRIKQQKVMEANGNQHKRMSVAINRATRGSLPCSVGP